MTTPTPTAPDFSPENIARIQAITDPTARDAAFKALEDAMDAQIAAVNASLASNPLTAQQYLTELAALDVSSGAAMRDFMATTQVGTVAPVPLGSHAGISYYLDPNTATVPIRPDPNATLLDTGLPHSDCIMAYRRIPIPGATMPGIPDIKYGFGLGKLMYHAPNTSATTETTTLTTTTDITTDLLDAGFFILLNAFDKSLWIALDYFPWADMGDWMEYPETDWGQVPGDEKLQVGVMQISKHAWEKDSPPSPAGGDPLGMFPALGCRLEGSLAATKRWEAAYAAAKAKSGGSTGH